MKAVRVKQPGGPDQLQIVDVAMPVPGESEVLVSVHASALNRADLLQREGRYAPPEGVTDILGLEAAGTVADVGANVTRWKVGDRVFGLLAGGGYAEHVVFHEDMLLRIPPQLSFVQAAAIPEVFLTAFQALVVIGRLVPGETVLIHAGGSGVGTAAIQLVHQMGGTPIVTASTAKHEVCLSLGAAHAIDYKERPFGEAVQEFTGGRGAQLIVDVIGAPYLVPNIRAASIDGRIVMLALMGGSEVDAFDLRQLFRKRLSIAASTLRNRSVRYKADLVSRFSSAVLPMISSEVVRPVIDSTYGIRDVAAAHRRMESNGNTGKIVLLLSDASPGPDG